MAVSVTTPGLRRALRGIEEEVRDRSRVAASHIGAQSVAVLRSSATFRTGGKGEYDTGRQMRSYVYALTGNRVQIGNSATSPRGFSYPQLNERRYRVAEKAIRRNRSRIVRFANQALKAGLREHRGTYRRARL